MTCLPLSINDQRGKRLTGEGIRIERIDQEVLARYVGHVAKGQHRLRRCELRAPRR